MSTLFESATGNGLFFDTSAAGRAYSSDLDFDYLLSQVGSLPQSLSDNSVYSSTLLDESSSGARELDWHVEWFDSSLDIVDFAYSDSPPAEDQLKPTLALATNGRTSGPDIKQSEGRTTISTAQKNVNTSRGKARVCENAGAPTKGKSRCEPEKTSFIKEEVHINRHDFLFFELTLEALQFYSDAFLTTSAVVEEPVADSPMLLLPALTPTLSTPATEAADLMVTTPVQKSMDKPDTDYCFLPLNQPSEIFIPDNFGYPLTPGTVDANTYVVDMTKSHSVPAQTAPKKCAPAPAPLALAPPVSNKRKRSGDAEMLVPRQQVAPQTEHKRRKLQASSSSMDNFPSFGGSRYTDTQFQYEQYLMPQTPDHLSFQPEEVQYSPPLTPFETMGWYTPQRVNLPKARQAFSTTPRTPPPHHYPITPNATPQKKENESSRLSVASELQLRLAPYPISPPNPAPPYPVTQQHLVPKLGPHDVIAPMTSVTKKEVKKGRKGKFKNGGEMFINFTADDRDTILAGVAPSGSSKCKKEKKRD